MSKDEDDLFPDFDDPLAEDGEARSQSPEKRPGLCCGQCGCRHFEVLKVIPGDKKIQRRKQCRNCGRRITTTERVIG